MYYFAPTLQYLVPPCDTLCYLIWQLKVRTKLILWSSNFKRLSQKKPPIIKPSYRMAWIMARLVATQYHLHYTASTSLCLNPSKASGPDFIKPIILKNLSNEIALFLTVLFQKSLDSGQVPHDWTKACITPIFKKGDKSDPINYRPISLTCILGKVIEHIIASNLSRHFEQNPTWFLWIEVLWNPAHSACWRACS